MATVTDDLVIRLRADIKDLRAEMVKARNVVETNNKKMQRSFDGVGRSVKQLIGLLGAAQLARSVIRSADEMQRLQARLVAVTGSNESAAEAMAFLRDMAREQKVDILDLADGYNRLLPSVKANIIEMKDMREILRLANDNIKAFGLSSAETQGLFLGLSQALGSGTVTMEDLRQVTDRLPGTLNLMAKSMGLSVNELKKMIATGRVTSEEILPALKEALEANEGAATKLSDTFQSAVIDFRNAFREMAAGSELIDQATDGIKALTEALNDPALVAALQGIGKIINLLGEGATQIMETGQFLGILLEGALGDVEGMKRALIEFNKHGTKAIKEVEKEAQELGNAFRGMSAISNESLEALISSLETAEESTDRMAEAWSEAAELIKDSNEEWAQDLADRLVDAERGFESLGDFATDVMRQIAAEMLKSAVTRPLVSAGTNLLTSIGTSLFAARADGGPLTPGQPTIVGERGPELIIPNISGTVVPNHQISNHTGITVNQSINLSTGVSETVRTEVMGLLPEINRQTINAVIAANQSGGPMARAMGNKR